MCYNIEAHSCWTWSRNEELFFGYRAHLFNWLFILFKNFYPAVLLTKDPRHILWIHLLAVDIIEISLPLSGTFPPMALSTLHHLHLPSHPTGISREREGPFFPLKVFSKISCWGWVTEIPIGPPPSLLLNREPFQFLATTLSLDDCYQSCPGN